MADAAEARPRSVPRKVKSCPRVLIGFFTLCFLAAWTTLTREFDLTIVCDDESFTYGVVLNATVFGWDEQVKGIYCFKGWVENDVVVASKAEWILREWGFLLLKFISLILITLMKCKLKGRCALKLLSLILFVLILATEVILIINHICFKIAKFRVTSLKAANITIWLKTIEYLWFSTILILVAFFELVVVNGKSG